MGQYEVLELLKEHKGKKFTVKMIYELYIKKYGIIDYSTMNTSLKKLSNSGLIKKEGSIIGVYKFHYWVE